MNILTRLSGRVLRVALADATSFCVFVSATASLCCRLKVCINLHGVDSSDSASESPGRSERSSSRVSFHGGAPALAADGLQLSLQFRGTRAADPFVEATRSSALQAHTNGRDLPSRLRPTLTLGVLPSTALGAHAPVRCWYAFNFPARAKCCLYFSCTVEPSALERDIGLDHDAGSVVASWFYCWRSLVFLHAVVARKQ